MQKKPEDIGIWQPHLKDGKWVFLRHSELDTEGLWSSDASRLTPHKRVGTQRICFLGESAAAGYFYAPHMTPAKALAQKLSPNSAGDDFEVIDLCCVDIDATRLVELALTSMQLNPDILLVFAGNNWPQSMAKRTPRSQDLAVYPEPLNAQDLAKHHHEASESLTNAVLDDLIQITEHFNADLLFVVPEINLLDWHREAPPPLLSPQAEGQWYALKAKALEKLTKGENSNVLKITQSMQELDQGCATSTARIQGEALRAEGLTHEARKAFRQEADARSWSPLLFTPGITQSISNVIRTRSKASGFDLVDLQTVFQTQYPQEIAGNQWFLDYCHFNLHGIDLAMQAIADKLRPSPVNSAQKITPTLLDSTPNSVQATANFSAAIYRTHSGQEASSVLKHDTQALLSQAHALWPEIKNFATLYLEGMALLKNTDALSEAFQNLHKIANGTIASRLYTKNIANKLDPEVSEFLRQGLHLNEGSYQRYIDTIIESHSTKDDPVNLVEHFFNWDLKHAWANVRTSIIHHSYYPESTFTLLSDGCTSYQCNISIRIPPQNAECATKAIILINECAIKELRVSSDWHEHCFIVTAEQIKKGFNKLSVQWPEPGHTHPSCLLKVKAELKKGLPAIPFSLFGQIAELEVNAIT